jgi:hypothetical protein
VTYPAAASLADLIDTVENVITGLGWTLYDAAAGANARAYRAVCVDGLRYKYIVLDYNTANYALMKVYESWNSATHTGTNLCIGSDGTSTAVKVDLAAGSSVSMTVTARYFIWQSPLGGDALQKPWCGCFEISPFNENDTPAAGYPIHCWTSGDNMFAGSRPIKLARTRGGQTGTDASETSVSSLWGSWGRRVFNNHVISPPVYSNIIPSFANKWDGTKYDVSHLDVLVTDTTDKTRNYVVGRLYGLISGPLIQAFSSPFTNDGSTKVDSRGWPDREGSLADHWLWHTTTMGVWVAK